MRLRPKAPRRLGGGTRVSGRTVQADSRFCSTGHWWRQFGHFHTSAKWSSFTVRWRVIHPTATQFGHRCQPLVIGVVRFTTTATTRSPCRSRSQADARPRVEVAPSAEISSPCRIPLGEVPSRASTFGFNAWSGRLVAVVPSGGHQRRVQHGRVRAVREPNHRIHEQRPSVAEALSCGRPIRGGTCDAQTG
jgi:hypothetical protein